MGHQLFDLLLRPFVLFLCPEKITKASALNFQLQICGMLGIPTIFDYILIFRHFKWFHFGIPLIDFTARLKLVKSVEKSHVTFSEYNCICSQRIVSQGLLEQIFHYIIFLNKYCKSGLVTMHQYGSASLKNLFIVQYVKILNFILIPLNSFTKLTPFE